MRRTGAPFAVALFDIDFFKRVNDERGHLVGDEVLRRFCAAAAEAIRATDRLGRFGGEEFLVLMPATDKTEAAHAAAERVRDAVAKVDWNGIDAGLEVTVSAGVAIAGRRRHRRGAASAAPTWRSTPPSTTAATGSARA